MMFLSQSGGIVWIVDRSEGLEDRDYAAGVTLRHRIAASLLTDSTKIVIQLIVFVTLLTAVYGMRVKGSWVLMLALVFLASVEGLAIGNKYEIDKLLSKIFAHKCLEKYFSKNFFNKVWNMFFL